MRYLATKTEARNAFSAEADLTLARMLAEEDETLRLLKHNFGNIVHLLNYCETANEIGDTLYCRLSHLPELADACRALELRISWPHLAPYHTLPDLPQAALLRTLRGHIGGVTACAVSPDGRRIVSASNDMTLKVWEPDSGAERLTLVGHTDGVNACAVSPDGPWIVSASEDKTLKVWDAASGVERLTLTGHTRAVRACAVSPDGQWIVSASLDKTLKVWEATSGVERLTLAGHTHAVRACAVSPDGQWIVSASLDKSLKVWDAVSGLERRTLVGHTRAVRACAVSLDGQWIVSASDDNTLRVWHAASGLCLAAFHADGPLDSCVWHPDGEHLTTVGIRGVYWLKMFW